MCGIIGQVNTAKVQPIRMGAFKKLLDTMAHRGPDGGHLWLSEDKSVCLGHRRLSIIDLATTADQPMSNEDNSIWIVFNGEIYNHAELRPQLLKLGHKFKTNHSDTETIIHAYEEWGEKCVNHLRGMFAFAVWNEKKAELFIARDRIGIKPLYYSMKDDHFIFASELKAIRLEESNNQLNTGALVDYLVFRSSLAPNTMIEGINKLDKGETLLVKRLPNQHLTCKKNCYYDFNNIAHKPKINLNYNDTLDRFDQLMKETIKCHLDSDAPLCLFLSGGVDSSLVAAIAAKLTNTRLKAFTIGLKNNSLDESPYAKYVANKLNLDIKVKKLSASALEYLDDWLSINDDLLSDPSALALFIIAKEARADNFKVALTGEGSDEFFGGYDWSYQTYLKRLLLIKKNFLPRSNLVANFLTKINRSTKIEELARVITKDKRFFGTAEVNNPYSAGKTLVDGQLFGLFAQKIHSEESLFENDRIKLLEQAMLIDINFRLPNDVLLRTDKATMGNSIEARVPFLDNKVMEFALSLPLQYKLGESLTVPKKIVKDLACRYFEKDFIYRPKMGFPIPVGEWLKQGKIAEEFRQYLSEATIPMLNYSYIKKNYQLHLDNKVDFSGRLFNLYLLEKYLRKWQINP